MLIDRCVPVRPFHGMVVCCASGPSLSLSQVRQIGMAHSLGLVRVIAINDAIWPCFYADVLYAADNKWWDKHSGVPGFARPKVKIDEVDKFDRVVPANHPGIVSLKNTGITGFDETPGAVRSGGNSGHQALHLAAKIFQPRAVTLVAYDYTDDGARSHYFGKHEGWMDKSSNTQNWRSCLKILTEELQRRGIKIFNASPQSTINWLPPISLDQPGWESL